MVSHTAPSPPPLPMLLCSRHGPGQCGEAGAEEEVIHGVAFQQHRMPDCAVGITGLSQALPVATGKEKAN